MEQVQQPSAPAKSESATDSGLVAMPLRSLDAFLASLIQYLDDKPVLRPVSERLWWRCSCGQRLHRDFTDPSAADKLCRELSLAGYRAYIVTEMDQFRKAASAGVPSSSVSSPSSLNLFNEIGSKFVTIGRLDPPKGWGRYTLWALLNSTVVRRIGSILAWYIIIASIAFVWFCITELIVELAVMAYDNFDPRSAASWVIALILKIPFKCV